MKDLREVIAKNISELRTEAGLTQMKLAELLNYSDKAVSKWERAEALPDITVLKIIADNFGVSVDYLLEEEHTAQSNKARELLSVRKRTRAFISLISVVLTFLVSAVLFSLCFSFSVFSPAWLMFIYAIPASLIPLLVFNSIWGRRGLNYLIVTLLMWSVILSVYLTLLLVSGKNFWHIFVFGAPIQVIFLFVPGISFIKFRSNWRRAK